MVNEYYDMEPNVRALAKETNQEFLELNGKLAKLEKWLFDLSGSFDNLLQEFNNVLKKTQKPR